MTMDEYNSEDRGCLSKAGGCLGKIIGFILLMIAMTVAKTCAGSMMRNSLRSENCTSVSSSPEEDLQRGVKLLRADLPHVVDDVTTCTDVELSPDALTYVYAISNSVDFSTIDMQTFDRETRKTIIASKNELAFVADCCDKTNRKVCYRYVSELDGQSHTISFNPGELK